MNDFVRLNIDKCKSDPYCSKQPTDTTRLTSLPTIIAAQLSRAKSDLAPPQL